MSLLTPNPIHKKLPREARHIIRRLLRTGPAGHVRAGVLRAHAAGLDHAVNRSQKRTAVPGDTVHGAGLRVRLGARARDLLRQLRDTKNVRAQQALVREINHDVTKRVEAAERWKRRRDKVRSGARQAWSWTRNQAVRARTAVQAAWAGRPHMRTTRGAAATRSRFGTVAPRATRSRSGVPARRRGGRGTRVRTRK